MGGGVKNAQINGEGFTLAELLGVIIIIGVLTLLILPTIEKSIKNSKEKLYQTQIKNIEMAANDWALDHLFELPDDEGETITVLLGQLKIGGYIDVNVSDPRDGVRFPNDMEILITRKYNNYVYGVVEGSGTPGDTELPDVPIGDLPVITLNGSRVITIEQGSVYREFGAQARTKDGKDISSSVVITGNVDVNKIGNYVVHYNVSYDGVSAREVTRVVKVIKKGSGPVTPTEGIYLVLDPNGTDGYKQAINVNVTVVPADGNILHSLTYRLDGGVLQNVENNQIFLDTDGEHTLEVIAMDNQRNVVSVVSETYYIDTTPPVIELSNVIIGVSDVESFDVLSGVSATDELSGIDGYITASGDLAARVGHYQITYTVNDRAHNITTMTRSITVVDSNDVLSNDPDGNLRFVGADTNNYVRFNGELWRIIGMFDGQMKIVRNDPYLIGAWDSGSDEGGTHGTFGLNDWNQSTLMSQLNNTINGFFSKISNKNYVDINHIWKLGGIPFLSKQTRSQAYALERGTNVYDQNPMEWVGAIGLMYPSDFGYSAGLSDPVCDTTPIMSGWTNGCSQSSWLYEESPVIWRWTITPANDANYVFSFSIFLSSQAPYYSSTTANRAYPTLYLKKNVKIVSGSGSSSDPYQIGL